MTTTEVAREVDTTVAGAENPSVRYYRQMATVNWLNQVAEQNTQEIQNGVAKDEKPVVAETPNLQHVFILGGIDAVIAGKQAEIDAFNAAALETELNAGLALKLLKKGLEIARTNSAFQFPSVRYFRDALISLQNNDVQGLLEGAMSLEMLAPLKSIATPDVIALVEGRLENLKDKPFTLEQYQEELTPTEKIAQEETPEQSQQLLITALKQAEIVFVHPTQRTAKFLGSVLISLNLGKLWGAVETKGIPLANYNFLKQFATPGVIRLLNSKSSGENTLNFAELKSELTKAA